MIGGLSKINRYLLAGAGVIGILAAGSTSARATDVQQLEAMLKAMQAQMAVLQKQVQEAKAAAAAAQASAANSGGSDLDLKVKWKGAPELSSSDGKFKFKVRGRVMTDYDHVDQSELGIPGVPSTRQGDISAVELRRARLGVEGVVFYDWKYKFEADFADNEVAVKDAYVAYANWWKSLEMSEIRAGNFYVYDSLEEITSSRFITFNERAAFIDAFWPSGDGDRQIGAGILLGDKNWSFQTGWYGASVGTGNSIPGAGAFDNDKSTASVRGTVAPINRSVNGVYQLLFFGASYRHRDAGTLKDCDADQCVNNKGFENTWTSALEQYKAKGADLHLADTSIGTPQFSGSDDTWHLEAGFVWGPFSMQSEYAQLEANGINCIGIKGNNTCTAVLNRPVNPTYSGWYVDASWYLTGETRNYEASTGEFGRTKVKNPMWNGSGGWGAWYIAGRYDTLDLSDKAAAMEVAYGCHTCGEQNTWLFELGWWQTDYTALKLQISQSHITGGNFTTENDQKGYNQNNGADIFGVGLRAQVDW
jgi:phosphate-selective porin OprO/OprP